MASEPLSPEWWLHRLYDRLQQRRPVIDMADRWYDGRHPAPVGWNKATDMLRYLLDATQTNFLSLLVDAAHERMHVEGFKVDGNIESDVWDIWQGNYFDSASEQVFLESMALGEASVLVDPTPNGFGFPTVTPEHPSQTIVEYEPGSRSERVAGLKVWFDDLNYEPLIRAQLFLPDGVWAYAARAPGGRYMPVPDLSTMTGTQYASPSSVLPKPEWELQPEGTGPNQLGEVPLVDFQCGPRMLKQGAPEFTKAIPIQRRINKTVLDRMVNQEYGAFKQKWVTGMEILTDPVTKQPIAPFNSSIERLFVAEDAATKFGQFDPEDIKQLLDAVDADIKHMAAIVPTPPHYLLGALVNLSAEALIAAEAALVARVVRHQNSYAEPVETAARLMLKAAGKNVPNVSAMTTIWRDPAHRTQGELVDALTKMATLGVPQEALWERWGATPQEIASWQGMQADALVRGDLTGMFGPPPAPPASVTTGVPA